MTVLDAGTDFAAEVETLRKHRAEYDFFYVHYKWTDSAGEDGDFDHKVALLEERSTSTSRRSSMSLRTCS